MQANQFTRNKYKTFSRRSLMGDIGGIGG
jgi:hypothetical protein